MLRLAKKITYAKSRRCRRYSAVISGCIVDDTNKKWKGYFDTRPKRGVPILRYGLCTAQAQRTPSAHSTPLAFVMQHHGGSASIFYLLTSDFFPSPALSCVFWIVNIQLPFSIVSPTNYDKLFLLQSIQSKKRSL